jgi:hypothetical protein
MTRRSLLQLAAMPMLMIGQSDKHYQVRPFPIRARIGWASAAATLNDANLLILDTVTHRVLVVSEDGNLVRYIGQIGQDKGAFFEPKGLVCDSSGNIHVLEGSNRRIQTFTPEGNVLREFPITSTSESLSISRSGLTYVNMPRHGKVITSYEWSGKVLGHFGELVKKSEGYPSLKDDDQMSVPLSRGYLTNDTRSNIYIAFQFVPIVRKYNIDGKLMWQIRLQGDVIQQLGDLMWDPVRAPSAKLVKKLDGIQFSPLVTGSYMDTLGNLRLLLGDSSILTVTGDGKQGSLLRPRQENLPPFVSATEWRGVTYLLAPSRCYQMLQL